MRGLIFALVFGLGGAAVLLSLGVWQVQRLAWKQGLVAALEARVSAEPVPLPAAPEEGRDEYLRVAVDGAFGEGELHVLTSRKPHGPGFRVVAPFETADGRRILVDRGFVPETMKRDVRAAGPASVVGILLWPDETDGFTPDPDRAKNMWFARDAVLMAGALDAEPVMLVAETAAGDWPEPAPPTVDLPNDHLQYAITWFSLAAIWLGMTAALLLRMRRDRAQR